MPRPPHCCAGTTRPRIWSAHSWAEPGKTTTTCSLTPAARPAVEPRPRHQAVQEALRCRWRAGDQVPRGRTAHSGQPEPRRPSPRGCVDARGRPLRPRHPPALQPPADRGAPGSCREAVQRWSARLGGAHDRHECSPKVPPALRRRTCTAGTPVRLRSSGCVGRVGLEPTTGGL